MNWRKFGGVSLIALTMLACGVASEWAKLPPIVCGAAGVVAVYLAGALKSYILANAPPKADKKVDGTP